MTFEGLILDFDGVLLESEYASNRHLADLLSELGHPTTIEHALTHFTGLSGPAFLRALESHVGGALPEEFHARRSDEDRRCLSEGLAEVVGAVGFVRNLPPSLPKAIASSSTTHWIRTHLDHIGLGEVFGDHVYSGHEHVERGKPAPDVYLHAAEQLGVPIESCAIIEDSEVGVTGAVASGARVIGLVAGAHCSVGHAERLRKLGVREIAASFDEVRRLLGLA
jgi:beta-phosphoglucomutase-like phosphatase (HAD superfamily)